MESIEYYSFGIAHVGILKFMIKMNKTRTISQNLRQSIHSIQWNQMKQLQRPMLRKQKESWTCIRGSDSKACFLKKKTVCLMAFQFI